MAAEPVECQVLVLRVSIHCEGCKKKVKKVLLHHDGVYRCEIDGRRNRVTVTVSKKIDAGMLVARLRKSGKQAEPWPEEPKQEQPAESQSQETKNQAGDASKPNEAAEKPAPDAAAEPSNAQPPAPEPEKATEETPPPAQEKKEADETKTEAAQQQPSEATEKAKQQQYHGHQDKPMDARVTMVFDDVRGRGGYGYGNQYQQYMPATQQPPVHVMSYNQARPMPSSSYYAAAPMPTPAQAPMPMPMSRPGPSHAQTCYARPTARTVTTTSHAPPPPVHGPFAPATTAGPGAPGGKPRRRKKSKSKHVRFNTEAGPVYAGSATPPNAADAYHQHASAAGTSVDAGYGNEHQHHHAYPPAPHGHGHEQGGYGRYAPSPLTRWEMLGAAGTPRRHEYFSGEYRWCYPTPVREGIYSMATDANRLTAIFSEENPNACTIV